MSDQCSLAAETAQARQRVPQSWVHPSVNTFVRMYALRIYMAAPLCGFADGGLN